MQNYRELGFTNAEGIYKLTAYNNTTKFAANRQPADRHNSSDLRSSTEYRDPGLVKSVQRVDRYAQQILLEPTGRPAPRWQKSCRNPQYPFSRSMEKRHESIFKRSDRNKEMMKQQELRLKSAIKRRMQEDGNIPCGAQFIQKAYEVPTVVHGRKPVLKTQNARRGDCYFNGRDPFDSY